MDSAKARAFGSKSMVQRLCSTRPDGAGTAFGDSTRYCKYRLRQMIAPAALRDGCGVAKSPVGQRFECRLAKLPSWHLGKAPRIGAGLGKARFSWREPERCNSSQPVIGQDGPTEALGVAKVGRPF